MMATVKTFAVNKQGPTRHAHHAMNNPDLDEHEMFGNKSRRIVS